MGIETFQYIDDLNASNPTSTDNVSEGDNHIRGIKPTLKNTFPNVTGAITPTETELNYVGRPLLSRQVPTDAVFRSCAYARLTELRLDLQHKPY